MPDTILEQTPTGPASAASFDFAGKLRACTGFEQIMNLFSRWFRLGGEEKREKTVYERLVAGEFNNEHHLVYLKWLDRAVHEKGDLEGLKEAVATYLELHRSEFRPTDMAV